MRKIFLFVLFLSAPAFTIHLCFVQASSGFTRDVPKVCQPTLSYAVTSLEAKDMKLDPIEDGYDSLQIRIWTQNSSESKEEEHQLYIIKRDKSGWTGYSYSMKANLDRKIRNIY